MNSSTVEHKIKVFISSRCDGATEFKYAPIRNSLRHMLEETGMIEVYCFESEPATSVQLPDDYISELNDSHLLVLLVDNKDNISEATLKEYQFAISKKIRIIPLFCDEYEHAQTAIEKEIIDLGISHIKHVPHFSDMAFEAYKSVMQDLAKVYKQKPEEVSTNFTQSESIFINTQSNSFNISKEILNEFIATKNILLGLVYTNKNNMENISPIDNGFSLFLKTVLCIKKYNQNDFKQVETLIIDKHNESIKNIIKGRLNALNEYYLGNPENALTILITCLKDEVKDNIVPEWLKNDIAIDIRNIEITTKGILNSSGQEILDNSKEYVHFPTIDRIANNIQNNIISFYTDIFQESPYSSTTRTLEYIFNDVATYYCTALFYGSITHLNLVKTLLQNLLFVLSLKQEDASLFNNLIYFTLLINDEKQLEKILRIKNPFLMNFLDTKKLMSAIDNIPIEKNRIQAKFILLKHLGYILLDDEFVSMSEWFIGFVKKYFTESLNYLEYNKIIIDTFKGICNRVPNGDIFNLFKELSVFGDRGRQFICETISCLSIKKLEKEQQKFLISFFMDILNDGDAYKKIVNLKEAVLTLCINSTIDINDLVELVNKKSPDIYRLLCLEMFDKDKKSSMKNINVYLNDINVRIETQTKGRYIRFSNNPFITIKNIVDFNNITLTQEEISSIVDQTTKFLLLDTQSYGDKCSALELLIFLASKFHNEFNWKGIKRLFCKNVDKILSGESLDFFDKTSLNSLKFYYQIFNLSIAAVKDVDTISTCANLYAMNSYDKIICLKTLSSFLNYIDVNKDINKNSLNSFIQLSTAMIKDEERDVRVYATQCLAAMLESPYTSIILREFSNIMNFGDIYSKRVIILALKKLNIKSNEVDFILQKAKMDRNYYIREVL